MDLRQAMGKMRERMHDFNTLFAKKSDFLFVGWKIICTFALEIIHRGIAQLVESAAVTLQRSSGRARLSLQKVHQVDLFLFVLNKSKIKPDCPYRDPRKFVDLFFLVLNKSKIETDWPYRDPRGSFLLVLNKSKIETDCPYRDPRGSFLVLNKSKIKTDCPYRDLRGSFFGLKQIKNRDRLAIQRPTNFRGSFLSVIFSRKITLKSAE